MSTGAADFLTGSVLVVLICLVTEALGSGLLARMARCEVVGRVGEWSSSSVSSPSSWSLGRLGSLRLSRVRFPELCLELSGEPSNSGLLQTVSIILQRKNVFEHVIFQDTFFHEFQKKSRKVM